MFNGEEHHKSKNKLLHSSVYITRVLKCLPLPTHPTLYVILSLHVPLNKAAVSN